MKTTLLFMAAVSILSAQMMVPPPTPTGVVAKYVGQSGGATANYYWVQAIYPSGRSPLSAFSTVTTIASLSSGNRVGLNWRAMPGAVAYDVLKTGTSTPPTGACNCALIVNTTNNHVDDTGQALSASYTVNNFIAPSILIGNGVPAAGICIAGTVGSLYLNTAGGAVTTLYVCTAAGTWTAK